MQKFAVAFEYDLEQGIAFLARERNADNSSKVALFDSKEAAQGWLDSSGEIDADMWNINILEVSV